MNLKAVQQLCAVALAGLLTACGGGGSAGGGAVIPPNTPSVLAGGWAGLSNGGGTTTFRAFILEDGFTWMILGTQTNQQVAVDALIQATLQSTSATSFTSGSGSLQLYNFTNSSTGTGTMTATLQTVNGIELLNSTLTVNAASTGLTLARVGTGFYNYDTAATLPAVTGTWAGSFTNDTGTVVVDASGGFTATTGLGCRITGTIRPRTSGKNVYDVQGSTGTAPCAVEGSTANGNAFITVPSAGVRQLTMLLRNFNGSNSGAYFGIAQ